MKTARFALIFALLSFALMSFSTNERNAPVRSEVKISISKVNFDRGLVFAIYQQVDRSFLEVEHQGDYSVRVKYNKTVYYVYGTLKDWQWFYSRDNRCLSCKVW